MKLSREINLLIIGSMVVLGILCAAVSIYSLHSNSKAEIEHLRSLLISERENNLKDLVANAYSLLSTANFYETAQHALSDMRFGENNQNYFFVVDTDGMFWVNPLHPEVVGRVKMEMTDTEGSPYIKQIIRGAETDKEGFIRYKEIPEGGKSPYTRLVHYKYFAKWKWIVCAGLYINDIENVLAQKEKEIETAMINQLFHLSTLLVLALIISTIFSTKLIAKRVIAPLLTVKNAAERIGQGDFSNIIEVRSSREIKQLAKSVQSMQISLDLALKMTKKMKDEQKIANNINAFEGNQPQRKSNVPQKNSLYSA